MALTNEQLQDELLSNIGERDDFAVAAGSRLERFLNIAQVKIARKGFWEELEVPNEELTLPASALTLAYPTTNKFRFQRSLVLKDGDTTRKLHWMNSETFDARFPKIHDSTATFTKRDSIIFTNWAKSWEFWPVPDIEYKLNARYAKWPTDLTTLVQTPDLEQKDDLLLHLTTADIWNSLGMEEKARKQFAIYASLMEDTKEDLQMKPGRDIVPDFEAGFNTGNYWKDPFMRTLIPMVYDRY